MPEFDSEAYWVSQVSWQIYYARTYELAYLVHLNQLPALGANIYAMAYAEAYRIAPSLESMAVSLDGLKGRSYYDTSSALSLASLYLGDIAHPQADGWQMALPKIAQALQGLAGQEVKDIRDLMQLVAQALEQLATHELANLSDVTWLGARGIEQLVEAAVPALQQLLTNLQAGAPLDTEVKEAFFKWLGPQQASGPSSWLLDMIVGVMAQLGRLIVDGVGQAVTILHQPAGAVILPTLRGVFDQYKAELTKPGPLNPWDSTDIAINAFNSALKLGSMAHAFGQVVELLLPTKHLGLGHLAAGLADAAGFEPVMRAAIGRRLDVALGRTAELQARHDYRTVWPDVRTCVEMFLEGRLTHPFMAERLAYEGWPEWAIKGYMGDRDSPDETVPYREARPIDLAYVYEDMTAPDDWILRQLIQSGFHRDDAQQLMVGLRRRSMRTHTSAYVSELVGAFGDGLIDQAGLRAYLRGLGLRQEAEDLVVNRAAMNYFRQTAKDLLAVYRDMVDKSLLSITDFRVAVAGLGFQEHTIAAEVARLDARARGRLLVEEQREAEAAVREVQRLLGTEYAERVRRGLVTPDSMERVLVQAGVEPAQAAAMARIAAIRQIPALKLPEALTPEAQAQQVRDILTRDILTRVRQRQLSTEGAVTYLVSIGVNQTEAEAEVGLAWQQGWRPPTVELPPKEAPEVREARRNRTQAATAAFQAGEFDEEVLLDRLRALGHSPAVAVSIVEQEATERRLRLERKAETERAKVLAEVQKLEETLILELVRKRQIEPEDAVAALISIGIEETQADLLVKRELLKAAPVRSTAAAG